MQLPDRWTQTQYEWLSALGRTKDPIPLLRQNRAWQRPDWVSERLDALQGLSPAEMRRLLPAVRGLIVVADRTGDIEMRCYARIKLLSMHSALYDLNGVPPVMAQLQDLLPRASSARRAAGELILSSLYQSQGEYKRALTHIRAALSAAKQLSDSKLIGQCSFVQAVLHYRQDELDEGVAAIQRARRYAEQTQEPLGIGECWNFEGVLRRARGEYNLALQAYRNARTYYEQANYPLGIAYTIANTGLVYWTMGLYEDARLHYREAMPRFQQLGAEWDVTTCTLNTAILLQHDGDIDGALELYRDALKRYEALGDAEGVAFCLHNMAATFSQARRYTEAWSHAHRAILQYEQVGNQAKAASARQVKAQALLDLNRPREAWQTLQAAHLETGSSPIQAIDYAYLRGEVQARLGNKDSAQRAFRLCLQRIQSLESMRDVPVEEVSVYLGRFRPQVSVIVGYFARWGDWRGAFEACQMGKGNALRLAWQTPRRYVELRHTEQARLDMLRTRYENAIAQQNRARTTAEQRRLRREAERRLAEWQNYQRELALRYPRLRWRQPEPLTPEQLPLDNRTLIVEYALAPDWLTIVWVRRRNGRVQMGSAIQHVSEETVRGTIRNLLGNIEREAPLETVHADAQRLYGWLIRPLEAQLDGVERVIVCPDSDLHAVPWAVLRDSQGRYLLERVAIGSSPSASAWAAAEAMTRGKLVPRRVLTVAVSEFRGAGGDTRARLSPLPGVEREVQAIARAWGRGTQSLLNQQATRSATLQHLPDASILHFATHAVPNLRMPMLSALALWGNGAPQWLYAHEAMQTRLNARLAVLSACRTGTGAFTTDGALGLHWAFLAAGCPTVLATLWQLPDEAAPLWAEAFYTRYKAGNLPTDALRRACLQLRQNPRYAHPRYWSAWQAFGAK